jgi:hypothetical protein
MESLPKIVSFVNQYGFPIVAAIGAMWMIYYVWCWATKDIKPILSEANTVLVALIDRVRMLDNDLIRLTQKVNVVLQLRGEVIEKEREAADKKINQVTKQPRSKRVVKKPRVPKTIDK